MRNKFLIKMSSSNVDKLELLDNNGNSPFLYPESSAISKQSSSSD